MKLVPWIRPAIIAPFLGMTAFVTSSVLRGSPDPDYGGRLGNWAMGMLLGSLVAGLVSGVLLAVDVAFLRANLRKPPTGRRAWGGGFVTPLLVFVIYMGFRPSENELGIEFFLSILFPIVVVALTVRFFTGEKVAEA